MKPEGIMIFAAGRGTRMGALTTHVPKPLIQVSGRPLIDHALDLVRDAGISEVVVNTHTHAEQLHSHLSTADPNIRISHETELLDTGGGLKNAAALFGGECVFTLNADMVWRNGNPLKTLAAAWNDEEMDALLCLLPREKATGHKSPGDFFLEPDGRITRRGDAEHADYIYCGAQIIRLSVLDGFEPGVFSLNAVWDHLIERGRLKAVVHYGNWVDVGTPEGIGLAELEIAR